MIKKFFHSVVVILALSIGGTAYAGVIFDPINAGSSVSATLEDFGVGWLDTCPGCTIATTLKDLDAQTAMLNVGDTVTFDFFDITVGGSGVDFFDIAATLAFASPGGSASDTGSGGFGSISTIFGTYSGGVLGWSGPVFVDLGHTAFTVAFEEGIALGEGDTATVGASVTLDKVTKVPEPGTLALLGIGLAGLGLMRRKQRA